MATYKSTAAGAGVQPNAVHTGLICKVGSYAVTSTENVTDNIIQMVKVPNGATVVDVILYCPDIDGATSLSLDVGDGDTHDLYIAAETTVGRAAGTRRGNAFVPKTYTADDTVDIKFHAASGTHADGTVYLAVYYTMDD